MSQNTLFAFSLFALVTSITPGPNNIMLLASGVTFGFRSSVPHMLGINVGFLFLALAVGLGIAEVFTQLPWMYVVLKWVGAIYLLYLAWCIATSGPLEETTPTGRVAKPMNFWSAVAFQWVNPKAWVMAVGAFSTYVPVSSGLIAIFGAALLFTVINLPCVGAWALCGSGLRRLLQVRRNLIAFNYSMATLLVLSLYPLLQAY